MKKCDHVWMVVPMMEGAALIPTCREVCRTCGTYKEAA